MCVSVCVCQQDLICLVFILIKNREEEEEESKFRKMSLKTHFMQCMKSTHPHEQKKWREGEGRKRNLGKRARA